MADPTNAINHASCHRSVSQHEKSSLQGQMIPRRIANAAAQSGEKGSREKDPTYHRDGDGSQRKGVADDVVHAHRAHARGSTALRVHPIHFAERRRVEGTVRGHMEER